MLAYLDSSVLLRVVFKEKTRLKEFDQIERAVTSALTRVECLRTIDRIRMRSGLGDREVIACLEYVHRVLRATYVVTLSSNILERASQPFPTTLGTLDAIHISSALAWGQIRRDETLTFLTHDQELANAARALGFTVLGS